MRTSMSNFVVSICSVYFGWVGFVGGVHRSFRCVDFGRPPWRPWILFSILFASTLEPACTSFFADSIKQFSG